jgi:hypothetical protein
MNTFNPTNRPATEPAALPGQPARRAGACPGLLFGKKPYHKPSMRYERVFETRALTCGKVQTTQASCAHNRKSS